MGLFDYVSILDKNVLEKVKCHYGHPQDMDLQTKDLEDSMDKFYLFNNALYHRGTGWGAGMEDPSVIREAPYTDKYGILKIPSYIKAVHFPITDTIRVYATCPYCNPVVFLRKDEDPSKMRKQGFLWGDGRTRVRPWVEYKLTFVEDVLINVSPVKLETREEVIEAYTKKGDWILQPDDEE